MDCFPLIHDHDGNVEDLITLGILATSKTHQLVATTLAHADCYLEPSILATQKLLTFLGTFKVDFAYSTDEGTNPFPAEYRQDSYCLPNLPSLRNIQPQVQHPKCHAPELFVKLLSQGKYDIVETGPFTNIAAALALDPSIAKNIRRIWCMGGAVNVNGNVENQPGHNGTAEWNIYNNPLAAQAVLEANIPITLVSLDITNFFPLGPEFLKNLSHQSDYRLSRFAYEGWSSQQGNGVQYFFWDTLAALCCINPSLFDYRTEKIRVTTEGEESGRTICQNEGLTSLAHYEVQIPVLSKPQEEVERFLLNILKV